MVEVCMVEVCMVEVCMESLNIYIADKYSSEDSDEFACLASQLVDKQCRAACKNIISSIKHNTQHHSSFRQVKH